jgi:hypothetical protein
MACWVIFWEKLELFFFISLSNTIKGYKNDQISAAFLSPYISFSRLC